MKKGFLIGIGYSLFFLSACAMTPETSQDAATRATDRMDLILAGELLEAYEYLSPGYRSSVSRESYLADMVTRQVNWSGAEMLGSECVENHCAVKFKIDYTVPSPVPGVRNFDFFDNFDEDWILSQGQWWFVPKK